MTDSTPTTPDQTLPEIPEASVERAAVARRERVRGDTLPWADLPEFTKDEIRAEARRDLAAAQPALYAAHREAVIGELREWLGSDEEYDALGAIAASLKENPQLVPERDVPLRLLKALRDAVDRFANHEEES